MPLPLRLAAALLAATMPAAARAQRLDYALLPDVPTVGLRLAYSAEVAHSEPEQRTTLPWLPYALLDRLEWAPQQGQDGYSWDASAFVGGKTNRVWLSSVGEGAFGSALEYLELQALYSRALDERWDIQIGFRWDALPHPDRFHLTVGGQGDATDALWLGAWAYLSQKGELSGRFVGQYNLGLIGSLILQPSFELDAYAQDVPELALGRGLSYGEAGLRLRYERTPYFAPYVGLSWERLFGRTARIARSAGEEVSGRNLVFGVRSEF